MCHLEKSPANEITEHLALTVCELELSGKATVLKSRSRRTGFRVVVNNGQNERKATHFHKIKTNGAASAAEWFQGVTLFGQ